MPSEVMLTWIIPVYNGEKYLAQAIDSILRQSCGDFEILVIDDGSTDRSLQIAQSYTDSRVKAIHKENGGVSSARNLGIESARSKYIAFLDADDVACRGAYDEDLHTILASEKYDVLSFSYYRADEKLEYGSRKTIPQNEKIECDIREFDPYHHFCARIYRYEILEREGIRFPEGIKIGEDSAFQFLTYSLSKTAVCIDQDWFIYRSNTQSVLHRLPNHEHMIRNSIPAWYWCGQKCKSEVAKNCCDAIMFAEITEYIEHCSGEGVPLERIQASLDQPFVHEVLNNYDALWNCSKRVYEAFIADPQKFWLKARRKGIVHCVAYYLGKISVLRSIYMRTKHKENIEAMV